MGQLTCLAGILATSNSTDLYTALMKRIGLGSFGVFKQRSRMQFAWGFRSCFSIRWCFDVGIPGKTN